MNGNVPKLLRFSRSCVLEKVCDIIFEKQEDLEDVCKACVDQENAEAEVTNAWAWRAWL